MKSLLIDGANFLHRVRAGFRGGEHDVSFNFFRNLRALVAFHAPGRVVFVLEGHPKARHELHDEYKANRVITDETPNRDEKVAEMTWLYKGYGEALQLLRHLPVVIVRHPDYEADDVIHNLAREVHAEWSEGDEAVIVSSDTDFIQSLALEPAVRLWNPVKKLWVPKPPYDYAQWKALKGDATDNIKGIPGVGEKTATKLATDPAFFASFLSDPGKAATYERNVRLVRFHEFEGDDWEGLEEEHGSVDFESLKAAFAGFGFASIVNDKSWKKFVDTFSNVSTDAP